MLERERGIGGASRERLAGGGRRSARRTGVRRCARGARAPAATNPGARPARPQDRSGAGPVDRHGRAGRERARAGAVVGPRAGARRLDAGSDRRPSRRLRHGAPRGRARRRARGRRVRRRELRALRAAPPAHQDLRRRTHRQRRGAPGRVRLPAGLPRRPRPRASVPPGASSWRQPEQSSTAPARSRSARAPGRALRSSPRTPRTWCASTGSPRASARGAHPDRRPRTWRCSRCGTRPPLPSAPTGRSPTERSDGRAHCWQQDATSRRSSATRSGP